MRDVRIKIDILSLQEYCGDIQDFWGSGSWSTWERIYWEPGWRIGITGCNAGEAFEDHFDVLNSVVGVRPPKDRDIATQCTGE